MATCPRFRVEARYLELHGATDVHDFGIPKATVYVLESWSIGA